MRLTKANNNVRAKCKKYSTAYLVAGEGHNKNGTGNCVYMVL